MSDTPITDAFIAGLTTSTKRHRWHDFARQLERENAVRLAAIDEAASDMRLLMLDCDQAAKEAEGYDPGEERAWRAVKVRIKKIETELSAAMRSRMNGDRNA